MLAVLATVLVLAAGARTPQAAVLRFIENHSPADACAQLAPAYKAAITKQYGPCLAGMKIQPKTSHVRVFDTKITGSKATLEATYSTSGGSFHELYRLVQTHGIWLISGSKQL
jgi:hypothetical protein